MRWNLIKEGMTETQFALRVEYSGEDAQITCRIAGPVSPIMAEELAYQLAAFLEGPDAQPLPEENLREGELWGKLNRRVDTLELSVRSAHGLEGLSIHYIGELVQKTELDLLHSKNIGRKSLREIKDVLGEIGLSLGMKISNWTTPRVAQRSTDDPSPVS